MSKIRAVELELGFAVDLLSSVSKMPAQRSIGSRFASIEPVIGCIVSDKIDRELAPNDQLFEKRFFVLRRRIAIFHREATESTLIWPKCRYGDSWLVPSRSG